MVTIIQGQRGNNEPTGEIDEHREDIPKQNDWIKSRHTAKSFLTTSVTILYFLYIRVSVLLNLSWNKTVMKFLRSLFVHQLTFESLEECISLPIKTEGRIFNKSILPF